MGTIKRSNVKAKRQRRTRMHRSNMRLKKYRPGPSEVPNPELMTVHILRKRRTSSRANIELSGKKKRKILRQLKHKESEKQRSEVIKESNEGNVDMSNNSRKFSNPKQVQEEMIVD